MGTHNAGQEMHAVYPACRRLAGERLWQELIGRAGQISPDQFPDFLAGQMLPRVPPFMAELAKLEWAYDKADKARCDFRRPESRAVLNPTLELVELAWKNLPQLLYQGADQIDNPPEEGSEWVVVFRGPHSRKMRCRAATDQELLGLKIVADGLDPEQVAEDNAIAVGVIERAISQADRVGLVLAPESKIIRNSDFFAGREKVSGYRAASVFTLQWHITQACDLHCLHCYDRSSRQEIDLDLAMSVLDDFKVFCRNRHVDGHISFTGGNPLLYPHFNDLYQRASDLGFSLGILGNPAPRERIEEFAKIRQPAFFQVSLEGLREHNDLIRGAGHFDRVMDFLVLLKDLDIYSMVMLTLTEANRGQVLPLAELLRGKADSFTFNRLSPVGEGARLDVVNQDEFELFLREYALAAQDNPVMSLKDNLFNIHRYRDGEDLFGGCAGFGCGAAFNFVSLLPDGEVHACRKFPSFIGNITSQNLAEIYDGTLAEQYRNGPASCRECPVRPVCGGCLAVGHGVG
ncbi:MAG: thio(seleno)oxazole modification radical SAM maturase SbtM, partial [Desulfobulbaceae bacterium]|nr:thio(seleno)oxazole modification radical SAM maturase SbtM [Desulfobulbaceae bacterium]